MFSHKKDYFTVISDELRKSKPSPALLETLATIFENVDHELHSYDKTAARNRLSQEFGLVGKNNTVREAKIAALVDDGKTDKEISDYLDLADKGTSTIIENTLGTRKKPKEGTPRHKINELLNPGYVDAEEYPFAHTEHQKKQSKKLLDKTTITILYFLNNSANGEKYDVLTEKVSAYLISESPYNSYSKLVGDEKISNHVRTALSKHVTTAPSKPGDSLFSISSDRIYRITEKGLIELEQDVLKSLPCLKKHIRKHVLPAINRASEKDLIKSERNAYKITEKGSNIMNPK